MMLLFVVLCFAQTIHGIVRHPSSQNFRWQSGGEMKVRKCELITIEMCRELGYNATGMPNLIGHESQPDAEQQLSTFTPLIQYGCSSLLKFFLCSAYVPICSEKALQLIGPCEPLCDSVRRRCEPVLLKFGFPWPVALNCSKFLPRNEDDSMCIDVPTEDDEAYAATTVVNGQFQLPDPAPTHHTTTTAVGGNCNVFRNPSNYVPLNRTSPRCALLCSRDDVFSAEQKMFADAWMSVWSGLCFVTTFITILTFLIDMQRIVYPERALVFMAVCYNVCSLSYLIRVTAGREAIACRAVVPDSKKVVVQEGLENTECTFIFLLLYYFSTAASVWWAILSVVWFLNAGLDRPYESFARHGTLLHVVAWSIPAVAAIVVIVLRSVDADELTAMCHVGYRNQNAQLWFVLIPTGVFLLVGVVFLTAGFICSLRTCKEADRSTRPSGKASAGAGAMQSTVRSSKIRIGAFLLVHVLLTVCILSIQCYEYTNRQQWPLQPIGGDASGGSKPNVTVLMFGVAASLTIGIVSAIWLWKGENLQSWQRFCSRLGRCCRCTTRSKQQQGSSAAAVRKQTMSIATASTDSGRLQTPLARGGGGGGGGRHPIYRVTTTDAVERNGRHDPHSSIALNSSHQCHHHHHHHHFHRNVSPLLKAHSSSPSFAPHPPPPAPPPSCDKRSSRSPLQCRVFSSDISVL